MLYDRETFFVLFNVMAAAAKRDVIEVGSIFLSYFCTVYLLTVHGVLFLLLDKDFVKTRKLMIVILELF